jgi:hypothetical protein
MSPEAKHNLFVVEQAVHAVLSPLGFKKQKLAWRRRLDEVLQQFTLFNMQLIDRYRPEWGLNLLNRSEDPRPPCWKLQVQWIFEHHVKNLRERLIYFDVLDFKEAMPDARRAELMTALLTRHVLPCFEAIQTEDAVRRMMGNYKFPGRASTFGQLPEEWYPPD